jgi:hypothetical protein
VNGKAGRRTGRQLLRPWLVLALLPALAGRAAPPEEAAAPGAGAAPAPALPAVSARPPPGLRPDVLWYPGFAREHALRSAWLAANEAERRNDYQDAARIFERLIARAPEEPHTYWRIARDYALLAELTPPADVDARARYGNLAMAWGDRGLQVDPSCGECCFYKYAGMGRVAMARGILSSLGWLKQIAETFDQCLEIPPSFVHEPWNPELGNFYYAAATFYRLLPDSRMLELSVGMRGDRRRSLEFSRRAVALVDRRIDYNVGLAASLLCVGSEDDRDELLSEGRGVLERVPELPELMPTDGVDRRAARRLLAAPDDACSYSRDAWNDGGLPVARRAE